MIPRMSNPPAPIPPPPPSSMPPGPPTPPAGPRRGWFARNWKWFIPLVVVLPILFCCGGATAIVGVVFGTIKSSDPYKHALAQAQANPQVVAAIGSPVEARFFVGGSVNLNNDAGTANLVIPVSGSKGSGTVLVAGTRSGGVWTYQTLEFHQSGAQNRIDLKTE
jgi:hypothetical protein